MNSTFKVVFNKARGALMVVNEITSSVQSKGTKTAVATAVAAMIAGVTGSAMAADADPIAKVGETTFSSIKEAPNSGIDGKTITLLGDVTNECGYSLGNSKAEGFKVTARM